jgi:hypothetical protein
MLYGPNVQPSPNITLQRATLMRLQPLCLPAYRPDGSATRPGLRPRHLERHRDTHFPAPDASAIALASRIPTEASAHCHIRYNPVHLCANLLRLPPLLRLLPNALGRFPQGIEHNGGRGRGHGGVADSHLHQLLGR